MAGVWVPASGGIVPPNAFPAGFDYEVLYIGRVAYARGILPGKVHPSHGVCYISQDGSTLAFSEYEVLCDCKGTWVLTSGAAVPLNAIKGGVTLCGEPLYIGRAAHEFTITVGKVQVSRGLCLIAYGHEEIGKEHYEVLVL